MADYNEKVIAFDAVLDKVEIVPPGTPVDSVYINGAVPGGVTLKLHAGARAGLQVRAFASVELCPPEKNGIYISTVGIAAGQSLSIVVGTGVYLQGA